VPFAPRREHRWYVVFHCDVWHFLFDNDAFEKISGLDFVRERFYDCIKHFARVTKGLVSRSRSLREEIKKKAWTFFSSPGV